MKGLWARGALGSLERQVMDVVWTCSALTVRDVQARLTKAVAYTTAMTTLDRLYKKGLVTRTQSGRAFVYTAAESRDQFEATLVSRVVTGLISRRTGAAMPILSNLVDAVGSQAGGLDLLNELEALVRDKRRRIARDPEER